MKLGTIKRITKESMSGAGDIPKWLDAVLEPLNDFIEKVGLSLQSRLTFEDNFLCKISTQNFADGVESEINPIPSDQRNLRVSGVVPLYSGGLVVDKFGWAQKANGNIGVTIGFDSGSNATCTVLILLR